MLFMGKTQQLVDVTVVNPTCPSHVDKTQKQLAVAEQAAQPTQNQKIQRDIRDSC